ncbi:unnamed protein product [Amoebophrya sp. A25]|nr:unnamed protein product [Amoebophrya sp. A25]|eukprot:GSA25T00000489001.1
MPEDGYSPSAAAPQSFSALPSAVNRSGDLGGPQQQQGGSAASGEVVSLFVPSELCDSRNEDGKAQNRLLKKYPFEKVGKNTKIAVKPGIIHFGGFQVHKEHRQVFTLRNVSPKAIRVMVLPPTQEKAFRINFEKRGLLAPGSAEEIEIFFVPKEWRYYHDNLQIFTGEQDENLVVPIHGYPSANDTKFPAYIDFGTIALATSKTKLLPLSCKIPVEFEFEIKIIEKDDSFEITPLRGVIPPESTTNVAITYLPTQSKTSTMKISLEIAQFDSRPEIINILGNCLPDLSKQEVVTVGEREYRKVLRERAKAQLEERVDVLLERKSDPFVDKPFVKPQPEKYKVVSDIKVPLEEVYGQHHINFVMNQTAGKMPLADLADFIREQREQLEATQAQAKSGAEKDETEMTAQDRQAKELRFDMRFRDLEEYDKSKDLKGTEVCLGEVVPTNAEKDAVRDRRAELQGRLLRKALTQDVKRYSEEASNDTRVPLPLGWRSSVPACWDVYANDTFSVRLQVIDRFVRAGTKMLMQNRGARRLQKLREAIADAGVTDRASCRAWVEAENKAAAVASAPKEKKKEGEEDDEVEEQDDVAPLELDRSGKAPTARVVLSGERLLLPTILPTSESALGADDEEKMFDFEPLLNTDRANFLQFKPLPLIEREDYKVFMYAPMEMPLPGYHMRPTAGRYEQRYACLEEQYVRGVRGLTTDGAEEVQFTMPEACLQPPEHDPLQFIIPDTSVRTWVGLPTDFHECDFEYMLGVEEEPMIRDFHYCLEPRLTLDGMGFEMPSANFPQWHDIFRESRNVTDPFSDMDPFPVSTAEGGGKMGPKACGDILGERIRYLPVERVPGDRDIPSDTDSDGRDEQFEMPRPKMEEYLKSWYHPDVIASATETHAKRVAEWTDLQEKAAKIDSAVFAEREEARAAQKKLSDLREPPRFPLLPEHDYEIVGDKHVKEAYLEELLEVGNRKRATRLRDDLSDCNKYLDPKAKLFLG